MEKKFHIENAVIFGNSETPKNKIGRPRNEKLVRDNSVQEGLTEEYTRATFIVEIELLEKLKDHAYTERLSLKTLINKIIRDYLDKNVDEKTLLHRCENILNEQTAKN